MNTMQNPRMQAQALKRMGRGPDTQLIHMTDSEIDALNGLSALVFKEPLRTNPQTGLPEAGLFKRLLPTVLAIGAATFLGPSAAMAFAPAGATSAGALATGLGTGLTAFGGHLAGQALAGEGIDFGRAALAGAGSGLTAGLTFDPSAGVVAGSTDAAQAATDAATQYSELSGQFGGELGGGGEFAFSNPTQAVIPPVPSPTFDTSLVRSPTEAFDYLAAEPLKRVAAPLALAGVMGEFDDPIEVPEEPKREPFVPKKFKATRERRDLDRDEDGEITQADIMEVVQELPEDQSSRFFTPTRFTPLSTGGLVNLQQGGSIKEAIQNLTGGEGSTILPMIAQAIVKPGEEEEDEATTKGYPLGTAGTAPGVPTTGLSVGGGQPPQPFQIGGGLAKLVV